MTILCVCVDYVFFKGYQPACLTFRFNLWADTSIPSDLLTRLRTIPSSFIAYSNGFIHRLHKIWTIFMGEAQKQQDFLRPPAFLRLITTEMSVGKIGPIWRTSILYGWASEIRPMEEHLSHSQTKNVNTLDSCLSSKEPLTVIDGCVYSSQQCVYATIKC